MAIRAVLFDFFGVISSEVADRWFRASLPGVDIQQLRKDFVEDADTGKISFEDVCERFAELASKSTHEVADEWYELAVIDKEMVTLIKDLSKEYKIGLCSNAPCNYLQTILEKEKLSELFDAKTISCELGIAKPESGIFDDLLQKLDVERHEALFIDDSKKNVMAAIALGISGHHFSNIETLRRKLGK